MAETLRGHLENAQSSLVLINGRFKCYTGLASTQGKLRMMLREYPFDTCAAVAGI